MRRIWGSLGVVVAIALAGCGSSDHAIARTGTRTGTRTVNPGGPLTGTATATAPASGSDTTTTGAFATLAPATIFTDSVRALAGARSFAAAGTETRSGRRTAIRWTYEQPSRVEARLIQGPARAAIIATPAAAYINANIAFAQRHFGGLPADEAKDLADRWLELDGRLGASESRPLLRFTPKQLSACLAESFPRPTVTRTTTADGHRVVVLHSASTDAGTADLLVSVVAPHYPVLFQRLDARSVANPDDPCEQSAGAVGQIRFSDWNRATVTLPARTTILP